MKVRFIDYKKDYLRFKKEYDRAWRDVNMRGDLILRKDVEEFEQRLAAYVRTKYAVALNSGTDAIYLSLKALGIKGYVALPSHTFKSTCGAVINAGASPYIYDLEDNFELRADVWIVVHIAGELINFTCPLNLPVIEDACQAFGAVKNPISNVQCWSFYPAKILGAKGDAGAITTNDVRIYNYVKEARNHFKSDNQDFGGNHRMDNLQAALLNIKIQHIDEILARRKEIAEKYLKELNGVVGLPNNQPGRVWQDFIIQVKNNNVSFEESMNYGIYPANKRREELYEYLKIQGVETMRNEYPFSPAYPKLPLAAKYEAETLRLPCNENLLNKEVNYVIKKVNEFFKNV